MYASRRPHTAMYNEGPGRRASVNVEQKPKLSTKRSASRAVSIRSSGMRCHVRSRYASISPDRFRGMGPPMLCVRNGECNSSADDNGTVASRYENTNYESIETDMRREFAALWKRDIRGAGRAGADFA